MLAQYELHAISREIRAAQQHARQIEPFSARYEGFDFASAYAVASLNHQAVVAAGARPLGRKIGFTNPQMWQEYDVSEPVWSIVYDNTVEYLESAHAGCALTPFSEPKIEPEIVLHFRKAPPAGADESGILACIDWIAHAFEIVQCHFPGWQFRAEDTVADWALHGRLLVGEPREIGQLGPALASQLASFAVALSCDDVLRETGRGSSVLGSPLAAVAHLSALLAKQSRFAPLQAGEIVTTGSLTRAQPVRAGQTWKTELDGIALPGLSVTFADQTDQRAHGTVRV